MSGTAQNQGTKPQVHSDDVPTSTKSADTTTSTDDAAAGGSGEGQQDVAGGSERPTVSPEPNCAICLGQLENKSFTDSCFHMFCFVCLQEWSKVKAECPLCKQPFKSIIHNVKSYNNYDQFYLDHHNRAAQPMSFGWNFDRSFHYRTTLTMDHRYLNLPHYHVVEREMASRQPSVPIYRRSVIPRYRLRSRTVHPLVRPYAEPVSTTNYRRGIYESGRRVSGLTSTHRRRRASPEFFSSNPAQMHRLVPWLNRELNALLYDAEGQVTFVLELILGLIKRFRIDSEEFYEHIHPYLHHFTRHFIHEFHHFACSPYTMQTYDTKAIYQEPSQTVSSSDSTASNSDVVVVDDDDDEPGVSSSGERRFRLPGTSSPWHSPPSAGLYPASPSALARSRWDSPTPGPSWDLSGSSHSPVNVDGSSDSDASTIIDPTYVAPETPRAQPARPASPESTDAEEVIFLSYDKPWEERSPIQLSSGSDSERSHFIKALKQENNKRKKARSLSESNARIRDRATERSRSPPAAASLQPSSRPHHSCSGHQASSASACSKSRHKKKSRHHDKGEEACLSSRPSHREKRKSSHSHTSVPPKKHRHGQEGENAGENAADSLAEHSASQKKPRHKKLKKNKERREKRSKKHQDPDEERPEDGQGPLEGAASSASAERADHCKKHPSGHKKSRVKNTGEAGDGDNREGHSGHHSDSLLSDTSTSSGHSTSTTTSLTDTDSSPAQQFSRQQRLEQALQERQRRARLPAAVPRLLNMAPSWGNISRLASMLAAHSPAQLATMPGPSQSSDDPVVISTSSDDSDTESGLRRGEADRMTSDSMPVAKTVVVPCSSNPEVPTPAIDFASMSASAGASRPLVVDHYIDVESISSEAETSDLEVVDVESVSDSDSEPCSSSKRDQLLQTDPEGDDTCELGRFSSNASSTTRKRTSTDVASSSSGSGKEKKKKTLSPCSIADKMKQNKTSKSQKSASCGKNPFSIDFILGEDVLFGNTSRSAVVSRPKPATRSFHHLSTRMSSHDVPQSQSQSQGTSSDEHLGSQPLSLGPSFHPFTSQQQEETHQTPLSYVLAQLARENQAQKLTEYKAGEDEAIDVLNSSLARDSSRSPPADCQRSAESLPPLPSLHTWTTQTSSPSVSSHTTEDCSPSSRPCSQSGAQGSSPCTALSQALEDSCPSPMMSQPDSESLCGLAPKLCQHSAEDSGDGNSVTGKETKVLVEDIVDPNESNHISASGDEKDFSDEDMDFGCIADGQVRALESSFFEEGKEKEVDALGELDHSADFPANDSGKMETDEAIVTENQDDVKKWTEDQKNEEEDEMLNGTLATDVDEHVEKLLLCDDINTCVPNASEPEKKATDHQDSVGSDEQSHGCESHTDNVDKTLQATSHQSDSTASVSEVNGISGSSLKDMGKDPHSSSAADTEAVSPLAETHSDSSGTPCMDLFSGDADADSSSTDTGSAEQHQDTAGAMPAATETEHKGVHPTQDSVCENSADLGVLNQPPAPCSDSLEGQAKRS